MEAKPSHGVNRIRTLWLISFDGGTAIQETDEEGRPVKWGISSLEELEMMKEKMDRVWHELFEEPDGKEEEIEQRFEKPPKSEGTKRTLRSRAGVRPRKGI